MFFTGPTGTGKTEISKALAEFIFGSENHLIRFDMSEYNLEHSDQKLIGAPPGYEGHEAGGQLTNAIKEKPFSIVLFDEIEKAHGRILDKFLQILEDGRLTSSKGELVDFSETFIIFTSNLGVSEVGKQGSDSSDEETRRTFTKAVENHFNKELKRPEILNKIGVKNIVPFNFISDNQIKKDIITSKFNQLNNWLKREKNIKLSELNDEQWKTLIFKINQIYDKSLGARGLIACFQSIFVDILSNYLFCIHNDIQNHLNNPSENQDYLIIDTVFDDDKISFIKKIDKAIYLFFYMYMIYINKLLFNLFTGYYFFYFSTNICWSFFNIIYNYFLNIKINCFFKLV
ncbi:AAA family ATPase [Mesomycoplasma hyorhinis]|uniref:AAA family ATPase n=1 Tax=Mesomycoplasma hyorhinis TaxID=2100 RepID=UPI00280BAF9C|nr:AAA family ATPase [Mesomycoplasma hyorhinis]